jgi:hypothetical protein
VSIREYFERRKRAAAKEALAKYLKVVNTFLYTPGLLNELASRGLKVDPSVLSGASREVPSRAFSSLNPVASAHESTIKQLKFLLASAPMVNVPTNVLEARQWVRTARSLFAYIHPMTMAKITFDPIKGSFMVFPGSPTKWVLTSLMPERRVIFSPLAIPGLEKILAE